MVSPLNHHYFLIEAINIGGNVYDTDQLSIIRGSSFLLKEAIDEINTQLSENLEAISTGASSGFFRVKESTLSCDAISKNISRLLEPHKGYSLFTFAIEHCKAENMLIAKEKLRTQLRFSQLKSLSIPTDAINVGHKNSPCELDGRRLQSREEKAIRKIQGKERKLSNSLYERLMEGRAKRANYYESELGEGYKKKCEQLNLSNYSFSEDLESLSDQPDYAKLNKKIAVIYMDGNKFNSIQNNFIKFATDYETAQRGFDKTVQDKRKEFLFQLLKGMITTAETRFPNAYYPNDDKSQPDSEHTLRLETLLWGGDEMTLVVPAWLGFEVMQLFFEITADWTICIKGEEQALTHAAGMVFCSAKSPIRVMRQLAESIANTLKEESREKNLWSYIILESIDYPQNNNYLEYWQQRYKKLGLKKPNVIAPVIAQDWQQQKQALQDLIKLGLIPRGQLYHIAQALQQGTAKSVNEENVTWDELFQPLAENNFKSQQAQKEQRFLQLGDQTDQCNLNEQLPIIAKTLFTLENLDTLQNRKYFWLHLIETWDYLIPNDVAIEEGKP